MYIKKKYKNGGILSSLGFLSLIMLVTVYLSEDAIASDDICTANCCANTVEELKQCIDRLYEEAEEELIDEYNKEKRRIKSLGKREYEI